MNDANSYAKAIIRLLKLKNNIHLLPEITALLVSESNKLSNSVTIESASSVKQGDLSLLADIITKKLGYSPKINLVINPDLIGGMKLKIGNNVIDATIKTKLLQIQDEVTKGK